MSDVGLELLARVESLMREMVESQKQLVTALSRHNEQADNLARLRRASAARTARSRAKRKSRDTDVTESRHRNVTGDYRGSSSLASSPEKQKQEETTNPLPPVTSPLRHVTPDSEVFEHWRTVMERGPRAKFDGKRRRKVAEQLRLGRTVDDLKRAIDGCRLDAFSMGQNDRGRPFNDLSLICRDAEHVEKFMALAERAAPQVNGDSEALKRYALEHPDLNDDEVLEGWHRQRAAT